MKKAKGKTIAEDKVLLNKPGYHETAAASLNLHEYRRDKEDLSSPQLNGELSISDCQRSIRLSLDIYTPDEYDNALFKVNQLFDIVSKAKEALEAYQISYNKEYKRMKKLRKQRDIKKKDSVVKKESNESTEESNQQGEGETIDSTNIRVS